MSQAVERSGGKRPNDLQSDPQHRVGRHRPILGQPCLGRLALDIFGNQSQVISIAQNFVNLGDVDVIEFLDRVCPFLELFALRCIESPDGDQLQCDRLVGAGVDRLIVNSRAGAPDFPRRAVAPCGNTKMIEKCFLLHNPPGGWRTIALINPRRHGGHPMS